MVVEEFHDQKIIYHLNIDEEVNNILMHLSSLKTIKTNRVIKGTTLVGAFYIFSLAFYSYLFHILFAWIRFERIVEQMKQAQGITEQLKAENQMEWVARMNNI